MVLVFAVAVIARHCGWIAVAAVVVLPQNRDRVAKQVLSVTSKLEASEKAMSVGRSTFAGMAGRDRMETRLPELTDATHLRYH